MVSNKTVKNSRLAFFSARYISTR